MNCCFASDILGLSKLDLGFVHKGNRRNFDLLKFVVVDMPNGIIALPVLASCDNQ